MLRLRGTVQNYEWGRVGEESRVGRLFSMACGSPIQEDVPYAEFWLGTHKSGPSLVLPLSEGGKEQLLSEWLREHPEALGEAVVQRWDGELPFLLKVLSVGKALSIQAHPNRELAEALHQRQPEIYRDSNHKPEMALALTHFEALCGFVSAQELSRVMSSVPEVRSAVGEAAAADLETGSKEGLRRAFTELMSLDAETVRGKLSDLVIRLHHEKMQGRKWTAKEELVMRLEKQYPGDVGLLSAFFFNYVKLEQGQAIFLAADEPHAYLSGDCVECMATSDNVVRAGLTPKYRDTQTLCSMLTYNRGMPQLLTGTPTDSFTNRYSPPFDEFEVDHIVLPAGATTRLYPVPGPSIFLVLQGLASVTCSSSALELKPGEAFFVPAGLELHLSAAAILSPDLEQDNVLHIFRAGVSSRFLPPSFSQ